MTIFKALAGRARRGATMVEYAILLGLIAVVSIGALALLGQGVSDQFDESADAIRDARFPPSITAVTVPADGIYEPGDQLCFDVSFTEEVFVTGGPPQIGLDMEGEQVFATYTSGDGTETLTFCYDIVPSTPNDFSGIEVADEIDLNGGEILDFHSSPPPSLELGIGALPGVIVNTAPQVIGSSISSGPLGTGDTLDIGIQFSEDVLISGGSQLPFILVDFDGTVLPAELSNNDGSGGLTFSLVIPDGVDAAAGTVEVADMIDAAGNSMVDVDGLNAILDIDMDANGLVVNDTQPDAFSFAAAVSPTTSTFVESPDTVTISGLTASISMDITDPSGTSVVVLNGVSLPTGTSQVAIQNGDTLEIGAISPATQGGQFQIGLTAGPYSTSVTVLSVPESCAQAGISSGTLLIDPDGAGPITPFTVTCGPGNATVLSFPNPGVIITNGSGSGNCVTANGSSNAPSRIVVNIPHTSLTATLTARANNVPPIQQFIDLGGDGSVDASFNTPLLNGTGAAGTFTQTLTATGGSSTTGSVVYANGSRGGAGTVAPFSSICSVSLQ